MAVSASREERRKTQESAEIRKSLMLYCLRDYEIAGLKVGIIWHEQTCKGHCRKGSFLAAVKLIQMSHKAGLTTVINCCPSKKMIEAGGLNKIMEIGKSHRCGFVHVIH